MVEEKSDGRTETSDGVVESRMRVGKMRWEEEAAAHKQAAQSWAIMQLSSVTLALAASWDSHMDSGNSLNVAGRPARTKHEILKLTTYSLLAWIGKCNLLGYAKLGLGLSPTILLSQPIRPK